jgi:hypothetical protein
MTFILAHIKKYFKEIQRNFGGIAKVIIIWEALETPVEFPELPRRKLLGTVHTKKI